MRLLVRLTAEPTFNVNGSAINIGPSASTGGVVTLVCAGALIVNASLDAGFGLASQINLTAGGTGAITQTGGATGFLTRFGLPRLDGDTDLHRGSAYNSQELVTGVCFADNLGKATHWAP